MKEFKLMNTEQKNVNGKSKTSKKIINSCFSQTSPHSLCGWKKCKQAHMYDE